MNKGDLKRAWELAMELYVVLNDMHHPSTAEVFSLIKELKLDLKEMNKNG